MFRIMTGMLLSAVVFQTVSAQTSAGSCNVPGLTVSAVNIERRLTLNGGVYNGSISIPASIVTAIQSGAIEFRERIIYNPQANTVTSTIFTAQPATALPVPAGMFGALGSNEIISVNTFTIDKIYCSTQPRNAVMMAGFVTSNNVSGPFPPFVGTPAAIAFNFTNDNPATITNVSFLITGVGVTLSNQGAGTVTASGFNPSSGGGTGTGPGANAGADAQVVTRVYNLDGSTSTAGPNGPVTYSWTMAPGGKTAAIAQGNTAMPTVTFAEGFGDYIFELTVTDAKGATSKDTVTISYVP